MFKNVASQKLIVFAFDSTTNAPKTGDAANLTAYVSKDFGSVTVLGDTSATEMDSTNAKGYYLFDLTQSETNADTLLFSAKSSTSNVVVIGAPSTVYTLPATGILAPATAGRTLVVDASGLADANVVKLGPTGSGTAQTARDIGASVLLSSGTGTGQLDFTSGVVKANLTQISGSAVSTSTAQLGVNVVNFGGSAGTFASGRPEVNTTHAAGTAWGSGAITSGAFASGAITAAAIAADAIGASELAADAVAEIQSGLATSSNVATIVGHLTDIKGATFDGSTDSNEAIRNRGDAAWVTATGFSTLDAAGVRTAVGLASANLDTQLGDLPTAAENADALLGRNIAGGSSTGRTVSQALYFLRNKWAISGGTLTVYATDDSTSSWTSAVTTTSSDPVTASDPA